MCIVYISLETLILCSLGLSDLRRLGYVRSGIVSVTCLPQTITFLASEDPPEFSLVTKMIDGPMKICKNLLFFVLRRRYPLLLELQTFCVASP